MSDTGSTATPKDKLFAILQFTAYENSNRKIHPKKRTIQYQEIIGCLPRGNHYF
jgi:hypothetical protein